MHVPDMEPERALLFAAAESIQVKGFMKQKTEECVILTGHLKGETYALLGPRMAATVISENGGHDAIVLGVTNGDDRGGRTTAWWERLECD